MLGITKNAYTVVGLGNNGKLESSGETLVSLGIVVLKSNLELNRLGKVSLLALDGLLVYDGFLAAGVLKNCWL